MAYDKSVPPAPVTPTMLPLATELDVRDVSVIVQPYKTDGKKTKRTTLGDLAGFINSLASEDWKTFTIDANNRIALGDYQRNVIIVPSAKDQNVTLDHWPTNGLVIYAPDWDAESDSTSVTIVGKVLNSYKPLPVIKGGVGIFLCSGQLVIGRSLIDSSAHSLATLKRLYVDDLIVKSDLTLQHGSNAAFNVQTESRVVGESTYYDLIITQPGDARKIKILGGSFKVVFTGINPGAITFDDGLKNFWVELDGDDFKTLRAERIEVSNSISLPASSILSGNIATKAVTADKINTYAVETLKIKDKAVTSEKLADQLAFVKTPKFPRKIYAEKDITANTTIVKDSGYDGIRCMAQDAHPIDFRMRFNTADSQAEDGDTYRIYNDTPGEIIVKDAVAPNETFTKIPAWTFKDFRYHDKWELA